MASSVVDPVASPRTPPSVPAQIVRATAGTLAVVLVLGLIVFGVGAYGGSIAQRFFNVVGDPRVRLAEGVTLSTDTSTVAVPVLVDTPWRPASDVAMITAATGGPVRTLDAADLERLDPTRFPGGMGVGALSDGTRAYLTPLGIVMVPPVATTQDGMFFVQLLALPVAKRYVGEAAQSAFALTLARTWGVGAGAAPLGQSLAVQVYPEGRATTMAAQLVVPGLSDPCLACGRASARFSADGTFLDATVLAQHVASTRLVRVLSPAAAFEAMKHYAVDSGLSEYPSSIEPVASARLVLVSGDDPMLPAQLQWTFRDAAGTDVGIVDAIPST